MFFMIILYSYVSSKLDFPTAESPNKTTILYFKINKYNFPYILFVLDLLF